MAKPKANKTIKKSDVAKRIREEILTSKDKPAVDEPNQSVATAQNVAKVAAAIEMMSNEQNDTADNLEKLVEVIVKLEKDAEEAEKSGDTEKAGKIKAQVGVLKGEANKQLKLSTQTLDAAPKTFGEGMARMMGVEPTQLREQGGGIKGLGKALFKGTRDYVGSITNPDKFNQSFIPTVDERIQKEKEQKTAKESISSALGEARKAEIAEKIKDVPDYLRVKVDPETGERYRQTKDGGRINEMNPSGEKNSRFDFGTTGRLVEEETGKGYDYGAGAVAAPAKSTASSIFEGESGTDEATKAGNEEVVDKLDEVKTAIEELNATLENKEMGGGGGGIMDNALDLATSRGLPRAGPASRGASRAASRGATQAATRGGAKGIFKGVLKGGARAARFLGPIGAAVTLGMAAYDATQGAMADPDASTGQKLKNAGSSLLNSLTFGLAGKSANEIREEAAQKQAAEAAGRQTTPGADVEAQARASAAPPGATPPVPPFRNPNRPSAAAQMEAAAAASAAPAAAAPIIMDNSQKVMAPPAASSSGASVTTIRDTRGSHLRFQDRRMVRVM
jgi:carbon monoxide dehydrogenase subunit G